MQHCLMTKLALSETKSAVTPWPADNGAAVHLTTAVQRLQQIWARPSGARVGRVADHALNLGCILCIPSLNSVNSAMRRVVLAPYSIQH